MKVSRAFQPITIHIETKEEAQIIEEALNCLIDDTMRKHGSKWFGFKEVPLSDEQKSFRNKVRCILEAINPNYKTHPLFVSPWS